MLRTVAYLEVKRKEQLFVDCLSIVIWPQVNLQTALADAVECVASQIGVQDIAHYLDA